MPVRSHDIESRRMQHIMLWVIFYLAILALFVSIIYQQTKKINTLDLPNGQIQIVTSKSKYTVGDSISYTLTNGLEEPITLVNKCPAEPFHIYKWSSGSWSPIHDTASKSCPTAGGNTELAKGASTSGTFDSYPKLFSDPGIYRIVAFADNYNGLVYADFDVVAPAVSPQTITNVIYKQIYTPVYIPVPAAGGGDRGGD